MKGIRILILSVAALLCVSCLEELKYNDGKQKDKLDVSFVVNAASVVRSSISPDEGRVEDVNLYVFCRGKLVYYTFTTSAEIPVTLDASSEYNVYVIANVGKIQPSIDEQEFCRRYMVLIESLDDIEDCLPLAGKVRNLNPKKENSRILLPLERLVCKVGFSIDKDALPSLEVVSARLCQSAFAVSPFMEGGSVPRSADDVADGDYCTDSDISTLNEGGKVFFYTLENCQGVLLPDNRNPWGKVPSNMDDKAEICTYIEVECRFADEGLYDGDVVYRLYLGQDNCSDFNLRRNTLLNVSLCLTKSGLDEELSWRVDSDYVLRDGFAYGWISDGRHSKDELYVGEIFKYSISVADELLAHLDSDLSSCAVEFRPFDGKPDRALEFSELSAGRDGDYEVYATCLRQSEGDVCLVDSNGDELSVLSRSVCIRNPLICISEDDFEDGTGMLTDAGRNLPCSINGGEARINVFLVDEGMANLNVSSGVGYDLSVFDFSIEVDHDDPDVLSSLRTELVPGSNADDGPAFTLCIECRNDGGNRHKSLSLLDICRSEEGLPCTISELSCGLSKPLNADLEYQPVGLTIVDNGWAGYGSTQLSMVVDNPSNIPINVDYWQILTTDSDCDESLRQSVTDKVETELRLDRMQYVVNQYNMSSLPAYGSNCSFVSERNGYGSPAIVDDDKLVYNLSGIDTYDILAALTYDGFGPKAMSHHILVEFADGTSVEDLTVTDALSDGTSSYDSKYGTSGFNDRGIWLYAEGKLLLSPESMEDSYPGLNPYNIKSLKSQTPTIGMMEYDIDDGQVYIKAHSLGSEGLVLSSMCETKSDGYVQTHPNGTWGKAVDNWCSAEIVRYSNGFPVLYSGEDVSADSGAVRAVFELVYYKGFDDSYNYIGSSNSYYHRCHPISLNAEMYFKVADRNDQGAYLFTPLCSNLVRFYHSQEGQMYDVPSEFSMNTFNFIEVR